MFIEITLFAYLIDKIFGEFNFIRHPVIIMGDYIKCFEKHFYKENVFNGAILTITLLSVVFIVIHLIVWMVENLNLWQNLEIMVLALLASTTIASKMLYDSVKDIITNPKNIQYLVSRDTKILSRSEINKASIETYAENLSDGVIAPLFYLLLFGVEGAFLYKAINTLDSMVGYRNERYEKFGKVSAILDDVVNYIPARITALLIALLFLSKEALLNFYTYGKKHDSPNAGHPISAMAISLGIKLGGDTAYFGKIKKKSYFGNGRKTITIKDIKQALLLQRRLDIFILFVTVGVLFI